jgi:hypothetical protein
MAAPPPERGSRAPASSPRGAPQSAPDRPATLAPHLVHLTGDWALWRTVCLPGAGFDLVPQGAHVPRVAIDDLVVSRETWRLAATDPAFAGTADESARYLQARAWAAGHGLPRHVFCRFTGESKPVYADLTSLASIDLISRAVRRARRDGADATVTVSEMRPAPDQAWLTDAQGHRYTTELRVVAVDQKTADQKQEG